MSEMSTYIIVRRHGWHDASDLEQADGRSNAAAAERTDRLRKLRSYVLDEDDGTIGTYCIYQATGPEAIREHARAADLPVDDIVEISGLDVQRPDPAALTG